MVLAAITVLGFARPTVWGISLHHEKLEGSSTTQRRKTTPETLSFRAQLGRTAPNREEPPRSKFEWSDSSPPNVRLVAAYARSGLEVWPLPGCPSDESCDHYARQGEEMPRLMRPLSR